MSDWLTDAECLIALVLLGLSLPALALAYGRAHRVWIEDQALRKVVLGATLLAAVLRWLIFPRWIATMYIGYIATERAIELSAASHYGVGSQSLYHALFAFLPRDHRTLMWINAVLGVLAVPLFGTFVAGVLRDRRAGAIAALLLAAVPLFVRNDNSDANNVPCLLWLTGGLALWIEALKDGDREALAGSFVLLILGGIGRPEMPVLVPLWAIATTLLAEKKHDPLRDRAVWIGLAVAAILVVPHAIHVRGATAHLSETGNLPSYGRFGLGELGRGLWRYNTVLWPSLFPIALPIAALGAFVVRDRKQLAARLFLLAVTIFSIGLYMVDLCRANMARVHVPGAMLAVVLASAGLSLAWEKLPGKMPRALLVLAVIGSAIPTGVMLWKPTNEQAEEDFLQEALPRLPLRDRFTLVRIAREDRVGSDATHFHFPDYLLHPPVAEGRVSSIRDFMAEPDFASPAYFYLGMRCYADFRDEGTPPPAGTHEQPACAKMRERFTLTPVIEKDLPNRGDVWLDYYGDAPTFHLGLYKIQPR
ncbi:MAG: glycosyltransferase family 39 protein [Byssovorax sp.]